MRPLITYGVFCGFSVRFVCDRRCEKAWGMNSRPYRAFPEVSAEGVALMVAAGITRGDDFHEYLADGEVDEAPANPGTYEADHGKPMHPAQHNKWCVRECERCETVDPGKPLYVHDFTKRVPNLSVEYLARAHPERLVQVQEDEADVVKE